MHDMMRLELAKQRPEELLREAERNRQAKVLRAARNRRDGGRAAPVWEIERHAGRLFKLLRSLRNSG
jgi:hypothetical protein